MRLALLGRPRRHQNVCRSVRWVMLRVRGLPRARGWNPKIVAKCEKEDSRPGPVIRAGARASTSQRRARDGPYLRLARVCLSVGKPLIQAAARASWNRLGPTLPGPPRFLESSFCEGMSARATPREAAGLPACRPRIVGSLIRAPTGGRKGWRAARVPWSILGRGPGTPSTRVYPTHG